MKSIQTKYLVLILSCILITSVTAVGLGVMNGNHILEEDSVKILDLQCTKEANEMDDLLADIRLSVRQIANYASENMGDPDELGSNHEKLNEYSNKVREIAKNTAENTDGAVAVYLRFHEDMTMEQLGFFLTKDARAGAFIDHELTDIAQYDPSDTEHVGWYYLPFKVRRGVWMDPYLNKNLGIYMISYIIPIYKGDRPVALVGMDIDMDLLYQRVTFMRTYDTTYAFLWSSEGDLLCHKDYPDGVKREELTQKQLEIKNLSDKAKTQGESVLYTWNGQKKYMRAQQLENGMTFAICSPQQEIEAPVRRLVYTSFVLLLLILLVAVPVTVRVNQRMTRPIKQLTKSAQKMVLGDLDVSIECNSRDEVGILADSFRQMAGKLKEQIEYIRNLAYTDVMTGTKNKTAYESFVEELDERIKVEPVAFAVVVMDINNLKEMNDNLGHEMGDALIADSASLMKTVFVQANLFRIGGDEFVAVLFDEQALKTEQFLDAFREKINAFNQGSRRYEAEVHIAAGATVFDRECDSSFGDVFRRADSLMYQDKKLQKSAEGEKKMRILETIDREDYTSDMPVFEKYTVRGVILRDGRIAMQQSKAGDYKILGGGVEPGESLTEALLREVQEESGLIVIPESIRPVGEIVEKRRDLFDPSMVYMCHSCFFLCDAKEQMAAMHMTESEKEKGFHLVWATPEEVIRGNEPFCESQPWSYRDREFVRMLPELLPLT